MYNLIFSIFVIIFVYFLIVQKNKYNNDGKFLILIFIYHLVFTYIYYKMSLNGSNDAYHYYFFDIKDIENIFLNSTYQNSNFIKLVVFYLKEFLNLSFFNTFLIFSLFGYIGIYILYKMFFRYASENKYLFLLLFFIPSLHFWTVSIGKDSLCFLLIMFILYGLNQKKIVYVLVSLILIYFVRPQLLVFVLFALGSLSLIALYKYNLSKSIKLISIIFLFFITFIVFKYSVLNLPVTNYSFDTINAYIQKRQSIFIGTSGYVDIGNYNIFEKVFTFLYRPFFESMNIKYLVLSFENLIFLLLTLYLFFNIKNIDFSKNLNIFMIIFAITYILLLSIIVSNMGISTRIKILVVPVLYLLIASVYYKKR